MRVRVKGGWGVGEGLVGGWPRSVGIEKVSKTDGVEGPEDELAKRTEEEDDV